MVPGGCEGPGSRCTSSRDSAFREQALEGQRRRDRALGVLMLAPALVYVMLLVGLPFLLALVLSVTNSSASSLELSFVGLQNFRSVIQNPYSSGPCGNLRVYPRLPGRRRRARRYPGAGPDRNIQEGEMIIRLLILMPFGGPDLAGDPGWIWIFDSTFSVINWMLKMIRLARPGRGSAELGDATLGMIAIIAIRVWRMLPFSTVILLAGLTSMVPECTRRPTSTGRGRSQRPSR